VLLEGNVAPNRLEEALLVDTLDEVVGQHVEKLGQLQAIPSKVSRMKVGLQRDEHLVKVLLGFAAGSCTQGADNPASSSVAVQQISLPANIRLVEEDWKVEHLLDPREHKGVVGVPWISPTACSLNLANRPIRAGSQAALFPQDRQNIAISSNQTWYDICGFLYAE